MQYIYLPKLLNDLKNLSKYNNILPDNISVMDVSVNQFLTTNRYESNYHTYLVTDTCEGNYIRYYVTPGYCPNNQNRIQYAKTHGTPFYIYASQETQLAVHDLFEFILYLIENAHTGAPVSIQARGEAVVTLLNCLVKNYKSEEAFKADIQESYPFDLTNNLFAFATINSNLDDLNGLAKAIYTAPSQHSRWRLYTAFYTCKLLNVLNEIDFWIDSADYNRLCAYEFLLSGAFARGNKSVERVSNILGNEFFNYRDKLRKRIIKAKQVYSKEQKISIRLNDITLDNIEPKNIKLHLQW